MKPKSNGEIDAIRWELQLRDEAADHAAKLVLSGSTQQAYTSLLVGLADFREASNSNTTRRPRTAWFLNLVGEAEKALLALPQPIKTVEKMELWLRKQVAPTLAAVVTAQGGDLQLITTLLTEGRRRWKAQHRAAISAAKPITLD